MIWVPWWAAGKLCSKMIVSVARETQVVKGRFRKISFLFAGQRKKDFVNVNKIIVLNLRSVWGINYSGRR